MYISTKEHTSNSYYIYLFVVCVYKVRHNQIEILFRFWDGVGKGENKKNNFYIKSKKKPKIHGKENIISRLYKAAKKAL